MAELRPMREEDIPAAHELNVATFEELSRSRGEEIEPRPDPAMAHIRYRHLVRTDPGGAWVAEDAKGLAGVALALVRDGIWGLSLLVVRPDLQSEGVGRALIERAGEYANGARGRIILSSRDPRAMRTYVRFGLELHPCVWATGVPVGVEAPASVREGGAGDIPLTETIDRHVRGAAHGADIGALLEMGQTLLIADERAYAVVSPAGEVRLLAGMDDESARAALRGALARSSEASVSWITSAQQWAVDVCVAARLELRVDIGAVCFSGDVGPMRPYLPSGAFL
jgi:GNAT superfamily N-acetyltransferase